MSLEKTFKDLVNVMVKLRAPGGCPWDREQTHESIIPYLIEESHETQEALADQDWDEFQKELGDVLCQVIFHANIAAESGRFTLEDICQALKEKLVHRHPHVFADTEVSGADEVLKNWEKIKLKEKEAKEKRSGKKERLLSGVPASLPALMRSYRIGQKAARVGFEFPSLDDTFEKVYEELAELKEALAKAPKEEEHDALEEELGDLLFSLVNVARHLKINPESALLTTARKFQKRFEYVEDALRKQGKTLEAADLETMDALWEEAKKTASPSSP